MLHISKNEISKLIKLIEAESQIALARGWHERLGFAVQ